MKARVQYQVNIAVAKPGSTGATRVHRNVIRGKAGDSWGVGALLTVTNTGRAASLSAPITSQVPGPVRYIALSKYTGDGGFVSLQEIGPDTIFEGQMKVGKATAADIGKRGVLHQDATTKRYAVVITDTNPCIEIVDVEPNWQVGVPAANKDYNLVQFRFLRDVLEKAPPNP